MATKLFEVGAPDVLYIIDLSSYLHRAYHALPPLSSPSGEPTHAVHGTVTMLERLFRERKPKLASIAMDAGRATFRSEIFSEYKANRKPTPDDLRVQIKRAEEIVECWGLSIEKQVGVEADDLIASLTRQARSEGRRVVIVSADKDLMQLVSNEVLMWDSQKNKVTGPPEVEEKFSVRPDQVGDWLALTGDTSDNIPGVPSVGGKTAATLLHEYGSLDGIFSSLEKITKNKLKQTLTEHQESARLSRKLVALKDDCQVDTSERGLAFAPKSRRNEAKLAQLYENLGFSRQLAALQNGTALIQTDGADDSGFASPLRSQLDRGANKVHAREDAGIEPGISNEKTLAEEPQSLNPGPTIVTTKEGLARVFNEIGTGRWALDLLTLRPSDHRGPMIALALSSEGSDYFFPFEHRYVGAPAQLKSHETVSALLGALAKGNAELSVHDLKRLLVILREAGIDDEPPAVHDTMLGSYLLDPDNKHTVENLGATVGIEILEYEKFCKDGRQKRTWDELEVEPAAVYAQKRVSAMLQGAARQKTRLKNEDTLRALLEDVELPLARLLAELERRGVLIDLECLKKLSEICTDELAVLEKQAYQAAGQEFNVNAPRKLEAILFDELGLKPLKKTKTARSTDAETLEALSEQHELPGLILKIRQLAKLQGTYIDALPALVREETGRVHGAWEQAVAATGRLSSKDPNFQNIPIRSDFGRKIRDAFIAAPGHEIVAADYSQIELRVLAHLSQDERLVEAFQTGQDVHSRTAMEIFEVAEDKVTREMRSRAKAVNFGVIYGQGENGLAKAVGIDRKEAARFIAMYFRRYVGVREFMDATLEEARKGHAVASILGRRRVVPDIQSGHRGRRLAAERIAMNMPIQGSAADILKLAMLKLARPVTPGTKMVLTVHDELVFEIPREEVVEARIKIVEAMESAYRLCVPLTVDIGSGLNWNLAH